MALTIAFQCPNTPPFIRAAMTGSSLTFAQSCFVTISLTCSRNLRSSSLVQVCVSLAGGRAHGLGLLFGFGLVVGVGVRVVELALGHDLRVWEVVGGEWKREW